MSVSSRQRLPHIAALSASRTRRARPACTHAGRRPRGGGHLLMRPPSLRLAVAGCGDHGRLGAGAAAGALLFRLVGGALAGEAVTAVAAGGAHTVALTGDGGVLTAGLDADGQLGRDTRASSHALFADVLLPEPAVAVAAGGAHSLALGASGRVWAWGAPPGSPTARPAAVPGLRNVTAIAAGARHCLAVGAGGRVHSWGDGGSGALGHAGPAWRAAEPVPRLIRTLTGADIVAVAAGGDRSAAVDASGGAWLWGAAESGRARRDAPPARLRGLPSITALALSRAHALALRVGGRVVSFGDVGDHGALGVGDREKGGSVDPDSPYHTLPEPLDAVAVSAGWMHSASVDAAGGLWAWGWGGAPGTAGPLQNDDASGGGQLGAGDELDRRAPARVAALLDDDGVTRLPGGSWRAVAVSCGWNHTAAIVEVGE